MAASNLINDQEIWALLDNNRNLPCDQIEAIIDKAAQAGGLEPWEVAALILGEDPELLH